MATLARESTRDNPTAMRWVIASHAALALCQTFCY